MKKTLSLLLALCTMLPLCACGNFAETEGSTEGIMNETTVTTDEMTNFETDDTEISELITEPSAETTASENEADTNEIITTESVVEDNTATEDVTLETVVETETESETETETETEPPIGSVIDASMKGDRPILFVTDEMLSIAKSKAQAMEEPWYSEWRSIEKKANAAITRGACPNTGTSATNFRLAACQDFIYARYLALAYIYTEDTKYLNSAVSFLMAYAKPMLGTDKYLDYSAATTDGKADIGLNIAVPLTAACDVYSIIYPYVTDSDKTTIEKWIKAEARLCITGHEFWIENNYYHGQYGNNHISSHLMGILAAAYVLEDNVFLRYALSYDKNDADILEMINRAILMEGDEVYHADTDSNFVCGEMYDRYRVVQNNGFGYSLYHLKFLTYSALMLHHNGVRLFNYYGENGENLTLPFYAYADYLIENDITLGVGHYSQDKSLNRENAYSIYSVAYYICKDEKIKQVLAAMDEDKVVCNENEIMGSTAPFLFGILD